jgi:adenylate kinase family enzyme
MLVAMSRFIKNNLDELAAYITSLDTGLILFDGRPLAGKTTLAKDMAKRIRCGVIDGDFIIRDQKRFVGALEVEALRERIEASLAATPLVVLSTVCAREVATKVDVGSTAWLWIERTSPTQQDIAVRDFADDYDADQPLAEDSLRQEVEAYIKAHDARGRADKVYINAPSDPAEC